MPTVEALLIRATYRNGCQLVIAAGCDIAIDHMVALKGKELLIAPVLSLESLIGKLARKAVHHSPIVSLRSHGIHRLKVRGIATRVVIVLRQIDSSGIAQELCKIALATHDKPLPALLLSAEDGGAVLCLRGYGLISVIVLFHLLEESVGFFLSACEHTHEFHPFGLTQWCGLLESCIRDQRSAHLLQGLITAFLKRRDEDGIGLESHDCFGVEVSFIANLGNLALSDAVFHVFVLQMAHAGDGRDLVKCM